MRSLAASTTYAIPFSTSLAPGSLPTATAFADATSLGAMTVSPAAGTNAYSVSVVLPANVTQGQMVTVRIDWDVDGEPQSSATLLVGKVGLDSELAASVDQKLSSEHGGGSWEGGVGAGGGGPLPLTVTLETTAGAPLSAFLVYLLDSVGEPVNLWLPTNDDGECTFHLAAGTYQVAVASRVGYQTPAVAEVTLTDGAITQPFTIAATTADPPALAGLCRVLLPTRGATAAAEGAYWTAQLTTENNAVDNDLVTRAVTTTKVAADGSAELYLPQGLIYQVDGYHAGHRFASVTYTVPATAEAYLAAAL